MKDFGGFLDRYTHESEACKCDMTFSVYLPPIAEQESVPALYWLSGLTCDDEEARSKIGVQQYAAEHGIAVVFPDVSPRGDDVDDMPDRYDLGQGAGFYVNATQAPWSKHYHMYDYIISELPALLEANVPLQQGNVSISGDSMGGHGALICALKNPGKYRSVSAVAPIANPIKAPWGQGCFGLYLGDNVEDWKPYDATCLVENGARVDHIFIDQGDADEFLDAGQLETHSFAKACDEHGQAYTLRMQPGYDHSYRFIATVAGDHIAYHAERLKS
jgi:S-formylglutathione hydrolase